MRQFPGWKNILSGFAVDLRSLALFRIGLAIALIADLTVRWNLIEVFYADGGVMPRFTYLKDFAGPLKISLHYISGLYSVQAGFFILGFILAVGLALGFYTRICVIGSWLLVLSLHNRNHFPLYGGDALMRLLLFWAMFAPIGARFSIDQFRRRTNAPIENSTISFSTAAILIQVVLMYLFAGISKWHPIWLKGDALYYAFNADIFATSISQAFLPYTSLLKLGTWLTLFIELVIPPLTLLPILNTPFRILAIVVFILFHGSHLFFLSIGFFPAICFAAWLAFLPSLFWQRFPQVEIYLNRFFAGLAAPFPELVNARPSLLRKLVPAVVSVCMILAVLWNISETKPKKFHLSTPVAQASLLLGLTQRWDLFAPFPPLDDGWFVFDGILKDGSPFDIFYNREVSFDKPADVSGGIYLNYIWKKYLNGLWKSPNREVMSQFGRYLCRQWNSRHSDEKKVSEFDIYFVLEMTPPPGGNATKPERRRLWHHQCFENFAEGRLLSGPSLKSKVGSLALPSALAK